MKLKGRATIGKVACRTLVRCQNNILTKKKKKKFADWRKQDAWHHLAFSAFGIIGALNNF
jgi:ferric-dicitrate binding protein FerR (iron transport regulator)